MLLQCYLKHIVFTLLAPYTLGVSLDVVGNMDLGPKWYYEYRVKHVQPTHVRSGGHPAEPKTIDIIIKNDKSKPEVVQIAEAHIYRPTATTKSTTKAKQPVIKKYRRRRTTETPVNDDVKVYTALGDYFDGSHENTTAIVDDYTYKPKDGDDLPVHDKTQGNKKRKHHTKGLKSKHPQTGFHLVEASDEHKTTTKLSAVSHTDPTEKPITKKKVKKHKHKAKKNIDETKETKKNKEMGRNLVETVEKTTPLKFSAEHTEPTTKFKKKHLRHDANKTNLKTTDENDHKKPSMVIMLKNGNKGQEDPKDENIYVKPHKVKDDPKVREFTKHVYEQSLKVFETIKEKITDYRVKKDINSIMRSYEDKFGDFVRETQNQFIKTRLGTQKVILNTVDTSNRILERLVHYLITKMDHKGILRNAATEHVLMKEVKKGAELENKHICTKLRICRSSEGFTDFVMDILSTVLSSGDAKIIQMRDAVTEVLKDTDVSSLMTFDAEKQFHKHLKDIETWDIDTLKGFLGVTKNIIKFRNSPIKVVGPVNSRVNKTMALLEVFDKWDAMIPPDNTNKLEWIDLKYSFKEWSEDKRTDIAELFQAFLEPIVKAANKLSTKGKEELQKNMNVLVGINESW